MMTRSQRANERFHALGYELHPRLITASEAEQAWAELADLHTRPIFNGKVNDGMRTQTANIARGKRPGRMRVHRTLVEIARRRFPKLKPTDGVLIHSASGCERQQAHADYNLDDPVLQGTPDDLIPCSMLVALQPNTPLVVWPRSAGMYARGPPYQECKEKTLWLERPRTRKLWLERHRRQPTDRSGPSCRARPAVWPAKNRRNAGEGP